MNPVPRRHLLPPSPPPASYSFRFLCCLLHTHTRIHTTFVFRDAIEHDDSPTRKFRNNHNLYGTLMPHPCVSIKAYMHVTPVNSYLYVFQNHRTTHLYCCNPEQPWTAWLMDEVLRKQLLELVFVYTLPKIISFVFSFVRDGLSGDRLNYKGCTGERQCSFCHSWPISWWFIETTCVLSALSASFPKALFFFKFFFSSSFLPISIHWQNTFSNRTNNSHMFSLQNVQRWEVEKRNVALRSSLTVAELPVMLQQLQDQLHRSADRVDNGDNSIKQEVLIGLFNRFTHSSCCVKRPSWSGHLDQCDYESVHVAFSSDPPPFIRLATSRTFLGCHLGCGWDLLSPPWFRYKIADQRFRPAGPPQIFGVPSPRLYPRRKAEDRRQCVTLPDTVAGMNACQTNFCFSYDFVGCTQSRSFVFSRVPFPLFTGQGGKIAILLAAEVFFQRFQRFLFTSALSFFFKVWSSARAGPCQYVKFATQIQVEIKCARHTAQDFITKKFHSTELRTDLDLTCTYHNVHAWWQHDQIQFSAKCPRFRSCKRWNKRAAITESGCTCTLLCCSSQLEI